VGVPEGVGWPIAYFTAPTSAAQVSIVETELNQVVVKRSDAASTDVVLLDKDGAVGPKVECPAVAPTGSITPADKCGTLEFGHRQGGAAAAGANSEPWFEFAVNTGASGFNLAADAFETMTVQAVIDVTYTNAAKRVSKLAVRPRLHVHADPEHRGSVPTAVESSLRARGSPASDGDATADDDSNGGISVVLVCGVFAALVVVAVGAVVIARKRSRRQGGEGENKVQVGQTVCVEMPNKLRLTRSKESMSLPSLKEVGDEL